MKVLWKLEKPLTQTIFTSGFTFEAQMISYMLNQNRKQKTKDVVMF